MKYKVKTGSSVIKREDFEAIQLREDNLIEFKGVLKRAGYTISQINNARVVIDYPQGNTGKLTPGYGDYIVFNDGYLSIVTKDIFENNYEVKNEQAN